MLAEIDLSAGQVFLFAPWVEYWMHNLGVPLVLSILIALVVVCGVGAINGLITVRLNVPSFVTTLAMNFILFGLVLIYSNQTQATPIPLSSSTTTGRVSFASQLMGVWLWSEILWVVAITIIVHVLLTRTRFGVRIIATGGNLLGAAEAGVPVRRVKVWAFVLCSFLAGLVGIVDAVKYGSLDPGNFGVDYILYAVGACVIGGTALTGGRGTVIGAFIGAILIGVLEDGLTLIGVSTNDFYVWVGVVIIFAMALNVAVRPADRPLEGSMSAQPAEPTPPAPASGEPRARGARRDQALRCARRPPRHRPRPAPGRGARARRRQRSRQEHARQDPERPLHSRTGAT